MTSGIYLIKNKVNGKIYVGMSKNIEYRCETHCNTNPLDAAICIEGVDNFECFILEEVVRKDGENDNDFRRRLLDKERDYMKRFCIFEGYNHHYNRQCIKKENNSLARGPLKDITIKKGGEIDEIK